MFLGNYQYAIVPLLNLLDKQCILELSFLNIS